MVRQDANRDRLKWPFLARLSPRDAYIFDPIYQQTALPVLQIHSEEAHRPRREISAVVRHWPRMKAVIN